MRGAVALVVLASGCCWRSDPVQPPQDVVGKWICPGGEAVEIGADGRVKGLPSPDEVHYAATTTVILGQVCLEIEAEQCARAVEIPPEHVGRWMAGTTTLEVREDGYTRIGYDLAEPSTEGVLVMGGAEAVLQMCAPPILLPIAAGTAGLAWEGTDMIFIEKTWHEKLLESKAAKAVESLLPSEEVLERHADGHDDWD